MGPATETFFTVALAIAVILAIIVFLFRPLWPRVARFFEAWRRRDEEIEADEIRERTMRSRAREEVDSWSSRAPDDPEEDTHESTQA